MLIRQTAARLGRSTLHLRRRAGNAGLVLLFGFAAGGPVHAQAPPQLFTAVANNQIANATPDQTRRLVQLRTQANTQAVNVIRINPDALKSNRLRVALPDGPTLDLSKVGGTAKSDQDFTWSGSVTGAQPDQSANATLVVRNGDVTGS